MIREGPIRVLLIDDSSLLRQALAKELDRCSDLHTFHCGCLVAEVRQQLLQCHPEVIVLDLDVPKADAFDLLVKLRLNYPVPVLVSARSNAEGEARALRAIELGAVDLVRKPEDRRRTAFTAWAGELAHKIRMVAAGARPVSLRRGPVGAARPASAGPVRGLVVLGASTGGTQAITTLMTHVPGDFPPLVMVQHMPPGFTRSFAERLNSLSTMRVSEAVDGEILGPGRAVIARGDTHLVVQQAGDAWRVRYTHTELVNRHCPSVDVLFESAVPYAAQVVGVLLTGMGADGARGLAALRKAGAVTIAQDEASCVVYGMPKEAVKLGAVMHSAPPEEIPALVLRSLTGRRRERSATGVRPSA